ncbi:MAG: flagellar assembly protein FliX [Hyphomonadaceae bacterium]|nr:flagellar assembly protein FliX [Hyphomonadaceae bacterium]
MKIDPTRPTAAPAPGRAARGAGGEGFALPPDAARAATATAPAAAVTAAHAVLALQMDDPGRRRRQSRRGAAALDALDRLQAALLSGADSSAALQTLEDQLAAREPSGDDGLDDALRAIDVRAAVELAKRARRGPGRA